MRRHSGASLILISQTKRHQAYAALRERQVSVHYEVLSLLGQAGALHAEVVDSSIMKRSNANRYPSGSGIALSSGRVLKAIAAPKAALRIALMTTSKSADPGRQAHASSDYHTIVALRN